MKKLLGFFFFILIVFLTNGQGNLSSKSPNLDSSPELLQSLSSNLKFSNQNPLLFKSGNHDNKLDWFEIEEIESETEDNLFLVSYFSDSSEVYSASSFVPKEISNKIFLLLFQTLKSSDLYIVFQVFII